MPVAPHDLDPLALVTQLGLTDEVVDGDARQRAIDRCARQGIVLPTFAELADPHRIDRERTTGAERDAPDARNLFRVHWYNDLAGEPRRRPRARRAALDAHRASRPDHRDRSATASP